MTNGVSISLSGDEVINGTMRMTGDRLLIKPLEWNEHGDVSKIIAVERKGNPVRGRVVAAGPGIYPVSRRRLSSDGKHQRIDYSRRFRPVEIRVGDIVELCGLNQFHGDGYKFPAVIYNGEKHLIVTERDVAIVRDDLREAS
jgi:co-chaperonin GroES (HSP10)